MCCSHGHCSISKNSCNKYKRKKEEQKITIWDCYFSEIPDVLTDPVVIVVVVVEVVVDHHHWWWWWDLSRSLFNHKRPRLQSKCAAASVCMEIMLGYPIALQRPKTIKIPTSKEMVYDIILYYISKI